MKFEKINQKMFESISNDEMMEIQGGTKGGTTNLTGIHTTGGCGCMDADDADTCGCGSN